MRRIGGKMSKTSKEQASWKETINFFKTRLYKGKQTPKEDYHVCAYCGGSAVEPKLVGKSLEETAVLRKLTKDHVIPTSNGGANGLINIVPSCSICNNSKGANDFLIWYLGYKYFDMTRLIYILEYLKLKNISENTLTERFRQITKRIKQVEQVIDKEVKQHTITDSDCMGLANKEIFVSKQEEKREDMYNLFAEYLEFKKNMERFI